MEDERLLKESTEEELLPLMWWWYFVSLQAVLALLKLKLQKVLLLPAFLCPAADCRSLVTPSNDHQSPLPPPPLLLDHDLRNCVHLCWDRRLAGEPTLIELGTSH